jgi:hypothetical protein
MRRDRGLRRVSADVGTVRVQLWSCLGGQGQPQYQAATQTLSFFFFFFLFLLIFFTISPKVFALVYGSHYYFVNGRNNYSER